MICPICKTRFADFSEDDFTVIPEGCIIERKEGANERRMKVFESNEERFCSDECSNIFLEECEAKRLEHELGFDRKMEVGWY